MCVRDKGWEVNIIKRQKIKIIQNYKKRERQILPSPNFQHPHGSQISEGLLGQPCWMSQHAAT